MGSRLGDALAMEHNKELGRFLFDEVINNHNLTLLDQVRSHRFAAELRSCFAPFRAGFPDWRQEMVELVAEGATVVARCRCTERT